MARRLALWIAIAFAALISLLIVGIPVPLEPYRATIESRASDALGREVRIGTIEVRLDSRKLARGPLDLGDRWNMLGGQGTHSSGSRPT